MSNEYDVRRIADLLAQGKSMTEIASELDGPVVDETAAANRASLQQQRSALHADSAPPGQEPDADPVEGMIQAARASGAPRGSDRYIEAGLERLFGAAQAGDARVTTEGVVDDATKQRWMADANQRQVANRQRSGFSRPR